MQKQSAPYVIKEAALIFESGSAENLNYVIGVYAPMELRIQRTIARDGLSREEIIKRMQGQINEEMKMKLCDFVITNDDQKPILPQVLALHEKLIRLPFAK
jgi:dephospho-CoA kinase